MKIVVKLPEKGLEGLEKGKFSDLDKRVADIAQIVLDATINRIQEQIEQALLLANEEKGENLFGWEKDREKWEKENRSTISQSRTTQLEDSEMDIAP